MRNRKRFCEPFGFGGGFDAGVEGTDQGVTRDVGGATESGDADGGFSGEAARVEAAFAGEDEVRAADARREIDRVGDDLKARAKSRSEKGEHGEAKAAGSA